MTHPTELARELLEYSATRLEDSLRQIENCLGRLTTEQIWHRPNQVSNAIGNLVIHLNGNVKQWILASLGNEPFERDRPAEFAQRDPLPTESILQELEQTIQKACAVIRGLSTDDLTSHVVIQGYDVSGVAAVIHVVEHFSLHTGQIVYATKLLTGADLSLYDAHGKRIDGRQSGTP
ncbi:MAG: hypothetical protein Tsb009_36410 [Planctomycetaceae bacterium]